MGHEFPFGSIQSGKQDYLSRCSAKKFVFHLLSNRIFWKLFVSGKPTFATPFSRGTQRQFSENICSEDDFRSRIFGTAFVVKFLACLPLLGFSNI